MLPPLDRSDIIATREKTAPSRSGAQLKTPKGTRDWASQGLLLRDHILQTIGDVLRRHGGIPLDTPISETSFQRNTVTQIKRYQIAKVYWRDQPAIARGRLREFYQCDFDVAGTYDPIIPNAEILRIIVEVFQAFNLNVTIKLSHRKILDSLFAASGVPNDKKRLVSSSVDKLDKLSWAEVRKEMVEEKGLPDEIADEVGKYVRRSGTLSEMIKTLQPEQRANENIKAGLNDMNLLVSYPEVLDVSDKVSFDLIAAGGRYNGLVDAQREKTGSDLTHETDVYIMALGGKHFDGLLLERLKVARELWEVGISTEFTAKVKPRQQQQINDLKDSLIAVIPGQDELESGQVRLNVVSSSAKDTPQTVGNKDTIQKARGELIPRENLVEE
ncbi:hypothetical protein E0Z10_g826 [Xylaria hypoxylon]|uniref:histidine--tRNA ligase n=1 Tax=Xylaria hypoxylon TaxID=37992 RepID=A0A4Z0Z8J4_9PEZI|nr:hypothetical protein E0Z10_g826 [Xylaria hypoxylon]